MSLAYHLACSAILSIWATEMWTKGGMFTQAGSVRSLSPRVKLNENLPEVSEQLRQEHGTVTLWGGHLPPADKAK